MVCAIERRVESERGCIGGLSLFSVCTIECPSSRCLCRLAIAKEKHGPECRILDSNLSTSRQCDKWVSVLLKVTYLIPRYAFVTYPRVSSTLFNMYHMMLTALPLSSPSISTPRASQPEHRPQGHQWQSRCSSCKAPTHHALPYSHYRL